jgi:single-strand DNA-binding protein
MPSEDRAVVPNINTSVITGNLTQDPEIFYSGDLAVCTLRVAVNGKRRNPRTERYVQKPNYINVVVFGPQGENCAEYLSKGRPVAVEGRLDWHEYESKKYGGMRESIQIIARTVQFLGTGNGSRKGRGRKATSDVQVVDVEDMSWEMLEGLADLVAERLEEDS